MMTLARLRPDIAEYVEDNAEELASLELVRNADVPEESHTVVKWLWAGWFVTGIPMVAAGVVYDFPLLLALPAQNCLNAHKQSSACS